MVILEHSLEKVKVVVSLRDSVRKFGLVILLAGKNHTVKFKLIQ